MNYQYMGLLYMLMCSLCMQHYNNNNNIIKPNDHCTSVGHYTQVHVSYWGWGLLVGYIHNKLLVCLLLLRAADLVRIPKGRICAYVPIQYILYFSRALYLTIRIMGGYLPRITHSSHLQGRSGCPTRSTSRHTSFSKNSQNMRLSHNDRSVRSPYNIICCPKITFRPHIVYRSVVYIIINCVAADVNKRRAVGKRKTASDISI